MAPFYFEDPSDYYLLLAIFGFVVGIGGWALAAELRKGDPFHKLWQLGVFLFLVAFFIVPFTLRIYDQAVAVSPTPDGLTLHYLEPAADKPIPYADLESVGICRQYVFSGEGTVTGSHWRLRLTAGGITHETFSSDDREMVIALAHRISRDRRLPIRYWRTFGRLPELAPASAEEIGSAEPYFNAIPEDLEIPLKWRIIHFLDQLPF